MSHRKKYNAAGVLIHHTAAGKAKDPATWQELDDEALGRTGPTEAAPGEAAPPSTALGQTSAQLLAAGAPTGAEEEEDPLFALFGTGSGMPELVLNMPVMVGTGERARGVRLLDLLMTLHAMPPEQVQDLQGRMLAGRLYPSSYYDRKEGWRPVIEPTWGSVDDDTWGAFTQMVLGKARKQWAQMLTGGPSFEERLEQERKRPGVPGQPTGFAAQAGRPSFASQVAEMGLANPDVSDPTVRPVTPAAAPSAAPPGATSPEDERRIREEMYGG
jgi:hypothetical protein